MKTLLTLVACLLVTGYASAQFPLEDFDSGTWPPAGWTVVDNIGNGNAWDISSAWSHGNLSGGMGECAAMDDDDAGVGQRTDTDLITPLFDIPGNHYYLEFDHHYSQWINDHGQVDIRIGGGPWINLWIFGYDTTEHRSIYLDAYAGTTGCQLRFRYDDAGDWAWFWHVDNVEVVPGGPIDVPIWEEDFDSGTWPPVGWTVIDNIGNGNTWNTASFWGTWNRTGGAGECAAMDDLVTGPGQRTDTELISVPFDVPNGHYYLQFLYKFSTSSSAFDIGKLDISAGGGPWVNLASWTSDSVGSYSISIEDYSGATGVQLRFHYDDGGTLAEYWHVDEIVVVEGDPPPIAVWDEDFDGGTWPPIGWTVVDNIGNGHSWETSSFFGRGNMIGGGECASIDSDWYGLVDIDGELITPNFVVTEPEQTLQYDFRFDAYSGNEFGDLDVSVSGGPWTNVLSNTLNAFGRRVIDLDPWFGMDVRFRFHYYNAHFDWFWQVDNLGQYYGDGPGTGYCYGDPGVDAPCPCGNDNDGSIPGSGCANGAFASGARLTGSGRASLTADSLVLTCTGLEPNNAGLYFQADNDLTPGSIWGDGLRCAGGTLKRLGVRFSDGTGHSDTSGYPQPISVKAGNIQAGDTKYYQCWYRNPLNSPCGADFNASNGYAIAWLP